MREAIIKGIEKRVQSYMDLVEVIDPADLDAKLGVTKNKSVAEHLWCVVGARESHARALAAGSWQGFSCSMDSYDRESFERALASSAEALLEAIRAVPAWTDEHDALLLSAHEHEVMHEGQIIRQMYGLGRSLPASWKWA